MAEVFDIDAISAPAEQGAKPIPKTGGFDIDAISTQSEPVDMASQGFSERLGERFEERRMEVVDTIVDFEEGKQGLGSTAVQLAGKGVAGPALDVLGEGVISLARGLSVIVPDSIEKPAIEQIKKGVEFISNTENPKLKSVSVLTFKLTYGFAVISN